MIETLLAQIAIASFSVALLAVHILASSSVFNDTMFENYMTGFNGYFRITSIGLVIVEYLVLSLVLATSLEQIQIKYIIQSPSRIHAIVFPFCLSCFFEGAFVIESSYKHLSIAVAMVALEFTSIFGLYYASFWLKKKHTKTERFLWQTSYSGWHVLSLYFLIIATENLILSNGGSAPTNQYWFFGWCLAYGLFVLFTYSVFTPKLMASSVFIVIISQIVALHLVANSVLVVTASFAMPIVFTSTLIFKVINRAF